MTRILSSGQIEQISQARAHQKYFLRAAPKRQELAVPLGHHRMRFQRAVLHLLRAKGVVENLVGFGKTAIDVALRERSLVRDVRSVNRMPIACEHAVQPIRI
jgi:hypothetical protein